MKLFRSDQASFNVSVSSKQIALLDAIYWNQTTGICAADITKAIAAQIGKEPRLATIYGAITDLEKKGLVEEAGLSNPEQGGRPRRLFRLTETGRLARSLGQAMVENNHGLVPAV